MSCKNCMVSLSIALPICAVVLTTYGQTTMRAPAPATANATYTTSANAVQPYNRFQPDVLEDPSTVAQQASCLLQIDSASDGPTRYFGEGGGYGYAGNNFYGGTSPSQFAAALLSSTVVIDQALEPLQIPAQERQLQVRVHTSVIGSQLIRLEVDLLKGNRKFDDGDAQNLSSKLIDQLKGAFAQSAEAHRKTADLQAASNAKDLAAIQKQLEDTRAKLHADVTLTSSMPNMYGDISNTLANLRNNRTNALAELQRSRARLAVIEPAQSSTLITEWEALVKQYQQKVLDLTNAHAADDAIKDAKDKLLDAQTHLATARQQIEVSDNNRAYRTQEASQIKSTIAEQESRVKEADDNIAKLSDPHFQAAMDEQRQLQSMEQNLVNRMAEMQNRMNQFSAASSASIPVTITILDGKTK